MKHQLKVGYQGLEGSHSCQAAKQLISHLSDNEITLIPLVTSAAVVDHLIGHKIDYGVLATENSTAGIVIETETALQEVSYRILGEYEHHIHHCLFKKNSSIPNDALTEVASHIQALSQCRNNLQRILPHCHTREIEDTAIGALYLTQGILPPTTAALCPKQAGIQYGLTLIAENIEDAANNITHFVLIEMA